MADGGAAQTSVWMLPFAAVLRYGRAALVAAIPLSADLKPRHWTRQSATQLLGYVEKIDSHGLNPADYECDALLWAIQYGNTDQLEHQATESFSLAARDLSNGQVRPAQRRQFFISTLALTREEIAVRGDRALAENDVYSILNALAPTQPQYVALRSALAKLPTNAVRERRKIEASLERWRWLPHELGSTHALVNVPQYTVHVIRDNEEVAAHRVIVGKVSMPTPQFAATISGVIIKPQRQASASLIADSGGWLVRHTAQVRRPGSAVGQVELEMPNPHMVYLHDTLNKEQIEKPDRTFSNGCIRTDQALDLAAELLRCPRAKIDEAVSEDTTGRIALQQPVPIYVLYFTAYAEPDGTVRYYEDPYSLDDAIYDSLNRG